jgi:mRNA interferase MazF
VKIKLKKHKLMIKNFLEWIGLKEKLHNNISKPPLVREGDLWWISLGENIGSEMNGKSGLFSRPVVIIKKLAHGFYLVSPTTSKPHEGTWYVKIEFANKETFVCLHQIRTVDYRRLSTRMGQIDSDDFFLIKEAFWRLYK